MPTFIVHEIGKKPRASTFNTDEFIIGREESSDLVLSNVSVSRMHASVLRKGEDYLIHPIALNNAILLDGQEVEVDTVLSEGSGLQIGRYSLVFTLQENIPTDYMQEGNHFIDVVCESCNWSGQLSRHRFNSLKETPACPRCGGQQFKRFETANEANSVPQPGSASTGSISSTSTNVLDPGVVLDYHERLESAKSGRIERIGGHSRLLTSKELSHEKPTTIGKEGKTDLAVEGFTWGSPVTVRWDRDSYIIEKGGWLPKITIDGTTVESARLQNGIIFTVGGSTFRYVGN